MYECAIHDCSGRMKPTFATSSAKPFLVLMPVPTAVPPCASWYSLGSADSIRSIPYFTCEEYQAMSTADGPCILTFVRQHCNILTTTLPST